MSMTMQYVHMITGDLMINFEQFNPLEKMVGKDKAYIKMAKA